MCLMLYSTWQCYASCIIDIDLDGDGDIDEIEDDMDDDDEVLTASKRAADREPSRSMDRRAQAAKATG